jgi:hypothetical protein
VGGWKGFGGCHALGVGRHKQAFILHANFAGFIGGRMDGVGGCHAPGVGRHKQAFMLHANFAGFIGVGGWRGWGGVTLWGWGDTSALS